MLLNDIHGRMNPTRVARVAQPAHESEVQRLVAGASGPVCMGGGMHAMGGHQLLEGALHLDMTGLAGVVELDEEQGLARVRAGTMWPRVIDEIRAMNSSERQWGIRQKQTGASELTIGGAVAANIHGRGLRMAPFVSDVEAIKVVMGTGEVVAASRDRDPDLFRHVIGGYGVYGVVTEVTLRLSPRGVVRRVVDLTTRDEIIARMDEEAEAGTLYGDFQFATDHASPDFLRLGIFSRYRPEPEKTPIPEGQRRFTPELWIELLRLARTQRSEAFRRYAEFYASTSGQVYHTDTHQLSTYVPRYHDHLADLPAEAQGSEIITELYVPRHELAAFLAEAGEALRSHGAPLTYGTVRLIEPERETALPWARARWACVIFNLLTPLSPEGIERSAGAFRALIDLALARRGSFYLTYHRFATARQLLAAYQELPRAIEAKERLDPLGRFSSAWWRSITRTLAEAGRNPGRCAG